MTERHASLYEDFDHYSISMTNIENEFVNSYTLCKSNLLEQYGNNLNFIYNNLENVPFGNVILGALYCTRNYAEYLNSLQGTKTVYEIDSNDVFGLRAMYFKYNHYSKTTTIENTFNFKNTNDIYSNALIDDVIKRTIKEVDLSAFKGKLYNPYVAIQIETEAKTEAEIRNRVDTADAEAAEGLFPQDVQQGSREAHRSKPENIDPKSQGTRL